MPNANLQGLLERRANTWEQYQEVLARASSPEGFSAEDRQTLDRMDNDIRSMTEDIDRLVRADALSARFAEIETDPIVNPGAATGEGRDNAARYSEAFTAWMRNGTAGLESEQRTLLRSGFVDGKELRAQGVATAAGGGYLVPEDFRARLVETMKFYGAVRAVAETITTDTGAALPWPTNDDTANKGAILGENTQITEQDLVIGEAQLDAYMYTSKLVRVSWQLLQDNAFNLEGWLPRKLGERIGRIHNEHFTTGTGVSQPNGVQTAAVVGKTGATGQTTSITYDDFVDLMHSVDVAYRNERSAFMLHDLSLAKARKLKDTTGQPLWQPSLQAGTPDTLLGARLIVNNDMPQMAASVKSVLYGDFFAGYIIRDVRAIQTVRLDERYADFLQVGFFGFARADAEPQDTGAYKAYQNSAT